MTLQNDNTFVKIDNKEVTARDSTDFYNEMSLYTQSKRGIKRAQDEIILKFNLNTTFRDIADILKDNNIQYRMYCAID